VTSEPATESPVNRPIYEFKAAFFKTLGHPARIRILEVLRDGELPVNEMIPLVGIEPSHLSQQLAVLRRANVVRSRREGSTVLYTVVDPRIFQLLEVAKAIITGSLTETRDLLAELETVEFAGPTSAGRRRR
jgi:ArsR family transcriptional regulator